ncbi:MAG TPA: universal stress protein [Usitatibacter sp.]|jgi:nucleotide-binding universal stress UspA family protein|nr:universal stress protein [Usitatibacter sp.]
MYKRILLAYDGSETGQRALLDCRDMANWSKAELYLVAVMPPPAAFIGGEGGIYDVDREKEEEQAFRDILDDGLRRLADAGHAPKGEVLVGDAVDEIVAYARKAQADLIVVGHKHLEGWARRWWRGSISKTLIEHAPCSVLVVITP